ncbi:MAG: hypothetical protein ACHQNE_06215 [Candidatus Kapaibacterium sp.]
MSVTRLVRYSHIYFGCGIDLQSVLGLSARSPRETDGLDVPTQTGARNIKSWNNYNLAVTILWFGSYIMGTVMGTHSRSSGQALLGNYEAWKKPKFFKADFSFQRNAQNEN